MSTSPADLELVRMQREEGYFGLVKGILIIGGVALLLGGGGVAVGAGDILMLPVQLLGDIAGGIGDVAGDLYHHAGSAMPVITMASIAERMGGMFNSGLWLAGWIVKAGLVALAVFVIAKFIMWSMDYVVAYQRSRALHELEFARQRASLQEQIANLGLVYPDGAGNLPISRSVLESASLTADILTLMKEKILNDRPLPLPAPAPTTLNYAPQISNDKALDLSLTNDGLNGLGAFRPLLERGNNEFSIQLPDSVEVANGDD